jgi:(1->4)-alpha-D-glucan 1-alpha-D-glucosylmutase
VSREALGSTYRLQLHGLGLAGARALVPYLADLGIETLYLSPILAAVPGSSHGYDVIDPGRIDPALGSDEDFGALLDELGARGMRLLLDIVPNHMAAHPANEWWWDVLRCGRASPQADVFDIDWSQHGGRVLVPTLGRPLAEIVARGAASLDRTGGLLDLEGQRFPLAEGPASGNPASEDLPAVLEHQHFRPAYWRAGPTQGNYRRFFDIDGLVGVRVEDPQVCERTHELIVALCRDPRVAGVRVDHIDGLSDPADYLDRLRRRLGDAAIVVEKILGPDETLDPRWPVDGTTGYEFADRAGALFIDREGSSRLAALGAAMTGGPASFARLADQAKREQLGRSFAADLDRLARLAVDALDLETPGHDLSRQDLARALTELTVRLDVYRTYLDGRAPSPADRARLAQASSAPVAGVETARALRWVADALAHRARPGNPWLPVARRWQQLSGAVMAKGVEDTATYRYPGLVAQADVGSDPDTSTSDADAFHRFARTRTGGLNTTSTHDSKRNEDARGRLAVLSEASQQWASLVRRWHRRFATGRGRAPHAGEELAAYQAMLALWPMSGDALDAATLRRVQDYAVKAAREAKLRTSWVDPDGPYERALTTFITRAHRDLDFRTELTRFSGRIAPTAVTNTLALVVLKACLPGVPDFYQGTELFEPTLTDPDNRRPVDFAARASELASLPPTSVAAAADLLSNWRDGRIKLHVIRALLQQRRHDRHLFDRGDYRALATTSPHIVAFARRLERRATVICVVPRLTYGLTRPGRFAIGPHSWGSERVALPSWGRGAYRDVLTGRVLRTGADPLQVHDVLQTLPVAVLRSADGRV